MTKTADQRDVKRWMMRIAIVDDNPMNITVVQEILKRAGYTDIVSVASAVELFDLIGLTPEGLERDRVPMHGHDIDLILMDMMMPGVDGIAACKAISHSGRLRDIPIIMVTAIGDSKKLAEALDAGAIDYVTKPINRIELLARIGAALRLKEQKDWRKERDRRMREELQLAREVQSAVLPQPLEEDGIRIGAIYRPSQELSGDLYAWHHIDEHRYGVAVIDAMGHGISSALVCMFIASLLKDAMTKLVEPRNVIRELNRRSQQLQFADQLIQYYFTAIYMVVDLEAGTAEYVNAGHPAGLLIRGADGTIETFAKGGLAIGLFDNIEIKKHTVGIRPGDRIVLVTDGIFELVGSEEEDQMAKLREMLQSCGSGVAQEKLEAALFKRDDSTRQDDRCLVTVDIL